MVNRLRGKARKRQNFQGFLAEGESGTSEFIIASKAGLKWRSYEDAIIIAGGPDDSEALDAALAAQLGRTPGAVRARRAKLKKMGKL